MRVELAQAVPRVSQPRSGVASSPRPAAPRVVLEPASASAVHSEHTIILDIGRTRQWKLCIAFDENRNMIYRFVDSETGDLIQQVPSDEILKVVRTIQQILRKAGAPEP
jgi:hypothetical protein